MAFLCADIFPSNLVEEQPLCSLTGTFEAMHASIGEVVLSSRTPLDLSQCRIFFFSHSYVIPSRDGGFGKLEFIPCPPLSSLEWPIPDTWSVISLKTKMASDIHTSLKYSKASRTGGLSWFFPIHIFAHMFHAIPCTNTPKMFICKRVDGVQMQSLLGDNWDVMEGVHKNDMFRCKVVESSVSFLFLQARSTLYLRFHYERWMKKHGLWVPLQASDEEITPIELCVLMPNGSTETISASKYWTLSNVREHFSIMGFDNVERSFKIKKMKVIFKLYIATLFYEFLVFNIS